MPSAYTATTPLRLLLDEALLYWWDGAAWVPWAVSKRGTPVRWEQEAQARNVADGAAGVKAPVAGGDRIVGYTARIGGTWLELNATKAAVLQHNTAAGAPVGGVTTLTPPAASALFTTARYSRWRFELLQGDGGRFRVEFTYGLTISRALDGEDRAEAGMPIVFEARADATLPGWTTDAAPWTVQFVPDLTLPASLTAPATLSVPVGATSAVQVVTVLNALGAPAAGVAVSASASDGDATVSPSAALTDGAGQASFTITGALAGGNTVTYTAGAASDTTAVTVTPPPGPVDELTFAPASGTLRGVGATLPVVVTVADENGTPISGELVSFVSSHPARATVAPASATTDGAGQVAATVTFVRGDQGPATITATADGVPGALVVTLEEEVVSVTVTPSPTTVATGGGTRQMTATALDRFGGTITGRAVAWTSSDPVAAAVHPTTGLVTGGGTTTVDATITGTVDGIADTATVTATPVPDLLSAVLASVTGDALGRLLTAHDTRHGISAAGATLTSWADARGTGFGATIDTVGGAAPGWDAGTLEVTGDGTQSMSTGVEALFASAEPITVVLVGSSTGATLNHYFASVAESASALEICAVANVSVPGAFGAVHRSDAGGTLTLPATDALLDGTRRTVLAGRSLTTGVVQVADGVRVSTATGAWTAAPKALTIFDAFPGFGSRAAGRLRAVLTFRGLLTEAELAGLHAAWALPGHASVTRVTFANLTAAEAGWTDLITTLGGDALVPAAFDARVGLTATDMAFTSLADVRGGAYPVALPAPDAPLISTPNTAAPAGRRLVGDGVSRALSAVLTGVDLVPAGTICTLVVISTSFGRGVLVHMGNASSDYGLTLKDHPSGRLSGYTASGMIVAVGNGTAPGTEAQLVNGPGDRPGSPYVRVSWAQWWSVTGLSHRTPHAPDFMPPVVLPLTAGEATMSLLRSTQGLAADFDADEVCAAFYFLGWLSAAQRAAVVDFARAQFGAVAGAPNLYVLYTDSMSLGINMPLPGGTRDGLATQLMAQDADFAADWEDVVVSRSGSTVASMLTLRADDVDPRFSERARSGAKVLLFWAGTNDLAGGASVAQVYADTEALVTGARTANPDIKVVVTTMLPRGIVGAPFETNRQAFNALLRADFAGADGLWDVAAVAGLGADGDQTGANYYDDTHLSASGAALAAPSARAAILAAAALP